MRASVELEKLTWIAAESALAADAVVLIALGAAAKEHGPHLRLDNDWQMAEYLKRRVMAATPVVVAPTISYHHYPAFVEYPGSTHLRFETARDLVVDIVSSLARFGPRRFYVLNTGVSTLAPLAAAATALRADGVLLRYTALRDINADAVAKVRQQPGGTHADEIETSMMLYIDPALVDMTKAVREFNPEKERGGLTRTPGRPGVYSASGVYGDATLATAEKGRLVVEALVGGIVRDVEQLRTSELPVAREHDRPAGA
jgi:creatinine amidohydrolase